MRLGGRRHMERITDWLVIAMMAAAAVLLATAAFVMFKAACGVI